MALLTLKDIGKIYVSEGSVAVGIRGVNLSFDRGEFVAVTGKSGSGKSTLLNVISGMDSYEEGELYIEGQSTSHYLQPDWEEYREKYISFIFQDYNIIESFTVLQNVELSLMHIDDPKERRHRALDLLERVGLSSHIHHKGSKLSGGQKQRTVIARALAKDSPIILADEPTGNLDSATSLEIIELLREVSKDKLLIVVTHNFDQLEHFATRHIRIFDGAVESDHVINKSTCCEAKENETVIQDPVKKEKLRELKKGVTLGRTIFTSKPRLSVFLCFLMIIGTLGIFMVTSLFGAANEMFEPTYMFNNIDGRVVVTTRNGATIPESELKNIAEEYGAEKYLRVDTLLDNGLSVGARIHNEEGYDEYLRLQYTYGEDFGDNIIGRYPEAPNEVLLYLPITWQLTFGKDAIEVDSIYLMRSIFRVTGVKYYYDNNKDAKCLFTEEGFHVATSLYYLSSGGRTSSGANVSQSNGKEQVSFDIHTIVVSFELPEDKIYICSSEYDYCVKKFGENIITNVFFRSVYNSYDYYYDYGSTGKSMAFEKNFEESDITHTQPSDMLQPELAAYDNKIVISDEMICDIADEVLDKSYAQASLFFKNNKEADKAAALLQSAGYVAVTADTKYEPDRFSAIEMMISAFALGFIWLLSILFLAFFINLCSSRTLNAFKGDMAIMRSMGIGVRIIRIAMYVRMLIALIPAFILVVIAAVVIFTSPHLNEYFVYLYAWQYALIFVGMILLTLRITYKQIKKLFRESVKKSLKGGHAE